MEPGKSLLATLTSSEKTQLELMAKGYSNKHIASIMCKSMAFVVHNSTIIHTKLCDVLGMKKEDMGDYNLRALATLVYYKEKGLLRSENELEYIEAAQSCITMAKGFSVLAQEADKRKEQHEVY